MIRVCQGRFVHAIKYSMRAVKLEELHEGSRNTRVLWFDYDCACIVFHAGDPKLALKMHLKILEDREAISGKYSEMTLQSYYTVGAMFHHNGDLRDAE